MAIVMRLDRMMADRKISLGELAERVGIADGNLSKIKNGKVSGVRFKTLNAICRELECQVGDLFEYVDDDGDAAPDAAC
jgi:putative transcriptional regulator